MKLFEKNTKGFKDAKTNRYVVLLILIFFGASLVSLLQHNKNKNFNTYQKIDDVQVVDNANLSYNNKTQTYKYKDLSLNNLDTPIPELNDKTYREVFKHGLLFEWQEYEVIVDAETIRLNGQYYYPSSNINYYIRIDATRYQAVNASRYLAIYGFEFIGFPTVNNSYINTSYKTYGRDTRIIHLYGHTLYHKLYIWDLNILGLQNVSKETLDYHFQIFQDLQQQENYEDLHFLSISNKGNTTLTLDNLYNVGNNLNYDLIVNDTEVIPINSSHFNYYIQDNNTYNFKLRYRTKTQQSLDLINFNTYITEGNNINEFGYNNHQNNLSNSQKINMDFTDLKEMKSFGLDIWKDFNFKKVTNLITKPIQLIVSAYEWLVDFFTVSHNNYIPADEPGGLMYHASTNWFDRLKDFTLDVVQFWK